MPTPEQLQLALQLYRDNLSTRVIGDKLQVTGTTIRRWLIPYIDEIELTNKCKDCGAEFTVNNRARLTLRCPTCRQRHSYYKNYNQCSCGRPKEFRAKVCLLCRYKYLSVATERLIELYKSGISLHALESQFGRSHHTIRRQLVAAGVKIRPTNTNKKCTVCGHMFLTKTSHNLNKCRKCRIRDLCRCGRGKHVKSPLCRRCAQKVYKKWEIRSLVRGQNEGVATLRQKGKVD